MPRSLDPDKYPPDFFILLESAQRAPVAIPHAAPAGFRGYVQAFLRACESVPELRDKAKGTQVTSHTGNPSAPEPARQGPHILVQRRTESAYAKAVASALRTSPDEQAAIAAADFLRRFGSAS